MEDGSGSPRPGAKDEGLAARTTPKSLMESGVVHAHLQIGQCIVTDREVLISTVLGSCVAVTFHHPKSGLSAMFHAMLPSRDMDRAGGLTPCKFVDGAIELIHARYRARDIDPEQVQVKLFGGGFTIEPRKKEKVREIVDVGGKNVDRAKAELDRLGYRILREHSRGERGRKIYLHTGSGSVWMKILGNSQKNG